MSHSAATAAENAWPGETIAAISTPFGEGAIALIRLSGAQAGALAGQLFHGRRAVAEMESHRQYFGVLQTPAGEKLDEVLLAVHRAPASYTGEEVVEISCHGGVLVSRRILQTLLQLGARSAQPGEFTQRAFLNGKMDLTQAEAVMDLIHAQTDLALRAAHAQLEGRLGQRMMELRERMVGILAHLEAFIDFPEEDISPDSQQALLQKLSEVTAVLDELLATAQRGRWLREGVRTVLFGAPNVGKSSLLNLLLGYDRAIVSAQPGTTRDSIEETVNVRGIPLRLVDTAGVREVGDEVEQAGIQRTLRQVEQADLILALYAAPEPPPAEVLSDLRALVVLNKADLGVHPQWAAYRTVAISCLDQRGVADLEAAIAARVEAGGAAQRDWELAINARHQAILEQARQYAEAGAQGLREGLSAEFIAEELRAALGALGEVVGRVDTEEVLGQIFSTFCIGK